MIEVSVIEVISWRVARQMTARPPYIPVLTNHSPDPTALRDDF